MTFEGVPETLMDRIITFLAAERAKLREAAVDRVAGYEGGLTATVGSGTGSSAAYIGSSGPAATAAAGGPTGLVVDFQRKVSPHERAALMADVLGELDEGEPEADGQVHNTEAVRDQLFRVVLRLSHHKHTSDALHSRHTATTPRIHDFGK